MGIKIQLTAPQARQLQPYVDRTRAAFAQGSPGMLVGQITWGPDGRFWLTPAFLDNEKAKMITEQGRDL